MFDPIMLALTGNSDSAMFDTERVSGITWDGDTTGRTTIVALGAVSYCHISDLVPEKANCVSGTVTRLDKGVEEVTVIAADRIFDLDNGNSGFTLVDVSVVVASECTETIPKTGIWVRYRNDRDDSYISKITFGTPVAVHTLKSECAPTIPVIDLDAHGISVQSLLATGGGSAAVDINAMFNSIKRGKSYLFRMQFGNSVLELAPTLLQYNIDGTLVGITIKTTGSLDTGFVQVDVLLDRNGVYVVMTPLGM